MKTHVKPFVELSCRAMAGSVMLCLGRGFVLALSVSFPTQNPLYSILRGMGGERRVDCTKDGPPLV